MREAAGGAGGIFSTIGAALSGKRAGGGGVRGGHAYLVNENTPNSEVFVPSQSGAVLNVPQAQAALKGAVQGQSAPAPMVHVQVVNNAAGFVDVETVKEGGRVVARISQSEETVNALNQSAGRRFQRSRGIKVPSPRR